MIVLEVLSWLFLIGGSLFAIIGGVGIVRLPEFFSRMHGAGITDTMGAGLILVGLMLQAGAASPLTVSAHLTAIKLLAILFFLTVTSPSSCHALARSALIHGMKPELDPPLDGKVADQDGTNTQDGSNREQTK